MAITKIKKQNTTYPINDDRIPELVANKYFHTVEENGEIVIELVDAPTELPALPEDASEKTYVPKAVNGVVSWVEETVEPVEAEQSAGE